MIKSINVIGLLILLINSLFFPLNKKISAYDYYENAPWADNIPYPAKSETVENNEEEDDETIETTTDNSTEIASEKSEEIIKETSTKNVEAEKEIISFSPLPNPRITFSSLPLSTKDTINRIMEGIKKNENLTLALSLEEVEKACDLIEETYYPYTDGGSGLHAQETKDGIFVTFHSHAYELYEKNNYIDREISKIAHTILAKGMTKETAIRKINDWIISTISYERNSRDLYSLLYNHKGNCESYSHIFEQLCDYVGIESMSVVGDVNGEGHEWNKVKINNKWYYIDLTFNQDSDNRYYLSQDLWGSHNILLEYKSTYPPRLQSSF